MASRLHSSYAHPVSRIWQSLESTLRPENLMYPLFIIDDPNEEQPIGAMPGISRFGVNKAIAHLEKLVPLGLNSVLLFSVTSMPKDDVGSAALNGIYFLYFQIPDRNHLLVVKHMPCPFRGPKMFWTGPNFLCQTKNLFTYCGIHKHFVPDKKMICIQ